MPLVKFHISENVDLEHFLSIAFREKKIFEGPYYTILADVTSNALKLLTSEQKSYGTLLPCRQTIVKDRQYGFT